MTLLKIFFSRGFTALGFTLSLLSLGVDDNTIELSQVLHSVIVAWDQIVDVVLAPLNIIPIPDWEIDSYEKKMLASLFLTVVPLSIGYWSTLRVASVLFIAVLLFFFLSFGFGFGVIDDVDHFSHDLNGLHRVGIAIAFCSFTILMLTLGGNFPSETRRYDAYRPLIFIWINVALFVIISLSLYFSGLMRIAQIL